MREETSAGIKVGVIVSVLFTVGFIVLLFAFATSVGANPLVMLTAISNEIKMPLKMVMYFALIGFVTLFLGSALVGAGLGFIFAVLVVKLPLRLVYSEALVLSFCIWLLFAVAVPTIIVVDLLALGACVVESSCFAYLYSELTRQA